MGDSARAQFLLRNEEPCAGSAFADAKSYGASAARTTTLIRGTFEIAVNARVGAAAIKTNPDPRSSRQTGGLLAVGASGGIVHAPDVQVIVGRVAH